MPVFRIHTSDACRSDPDPKRIKIRKIQKHVDPVDPDLDSFQDPDHCGMKFVSGKLFLTSRKNDLGCSFRIPDPDPDIFPSPDYPVTGSGSATLGIGHLHNLSSRSDLDFKFLTYS
jgi:hypothetical protein